MLIVIEHDQDADFSFYSAKEQARGLVALEMTIHPEGEGDITNWHHNYRRDITLAALSNITFYEDSDEWTEGEFTRVEDIPASCGYLREVAQQLLEEAGPEASPFMKPV